MQVLTKWCEWCGEHASTASKVCVKSKAGDFHSFDQRIISPPVVPDEGIKKDAGKTRLDLLPPLALESVGRVLTKGAVTYGPNNWRKVKGWRWRYTGAAMRHLLAYMKGERIDDKGDRPTHEPHLACALCCLMFVLEQDLLGTLDGDVEVERK